MARERQEMTKRKAVYNPEADKKWSRANKEHKRFLQYRSSARVFIRELATDEDLTELKKLIALREASYPNQLDKNNNPIN